MDAMQNTIVVRRFVEELWNGRNLDLADTLFSSDCRTHQLRSGIPMEAVPRGPEAVKKHMAEWLAGFPDLRFEIEQTLAEDDRVLSQWVMHGTHTGTWLGIPATGRTVSIRMMTVHRIRDGKISEDWVLVESLGFFQQLGALPPTSAILSDFVKRLSDQSQSAQGGVHSGGRLSPNPGRKS
jgi:steroid delta-isomerase-like uncharacterized protein